MATIKDIARLAGVGIGTVSRVINGGEKVKDTTQERVLKAAEALNYRPNRVARNLVRGVQDPYRFWCGYARGEPFLAF
jgi:LacI family transcriptional regulator